jgi:arsenate reductase
VVLARAAEDLAARFAGVFCLPTVQRCLAARVHSHLPVLAIRFVHDRLTAAAQSRGAIVTAIPEVLFVCVHNAGRSQMAAALLDHHAAGRVHVRSAGSTPAEEINPVVRAAMAELGLNLSRGYPKPLTDDVVCAADVIITMGCGDACPVYPGKRYLDWDLPDPAGKNIQEIRPIRDDIDRRVRTLLEQLVPATRRPATLSTRAHPRPPSRQGGTCDE